MSMPPINAAVQQQPPTQSRPAVYALRFHGSGVDLAIIVLKNILLTIVTLGIYSFWGKVNVRKFLWHNSEFHGNRFAYHGTGGELLRGYLKVGGFYVVMMALMNIAQRMGSAVYGVAMLFVFVCFIVIVPYAIYQSQRYLYSRTTWRGIRLGMAPDVKPFVQAFIGGYLLTILTLGFYAPVWQNRLYGIRMNNSRLGTLSMRYTGKDKEAFMIFLKALPLIIITLGIYGLWYRAKVSVYRAEHTWIGSQTLGAARGHLEMKGGEYLGLVLLNLVCIVLTAGLAMPWVIAHNMSWFLQRFAFVGNVNFDGVVQVASQGDAAADGMADALNVGFGV